jgi:chromate transport protein ChrA
MMLTAGYDSLQHHARALAAIAGTLAAAVGMMALSAWQLLRPHLLRPRRALRAVLLATLSAFLAYRFRMSPIAILGLAALAGFFWRIPEQA